MPISDGRHMIDAARKAGQLENLVLNTDAKPIGTTKR